MKRLAILNYMFMFDPTDTGFSSGSSFESFLADFSAAHGMEANVIETAGSGVKAIFFTKIEVLTSAANSTPKQDVRGDIKKVQQSTPPKNFKQFKNPKHDNTQAPKLGFQVGKSNRMKAREY